MYTPVNPYIGLTEIIEELKMKPEDVWCKPKLKEELLRAIDRASRWVDNYTQRDYFFHDFSATPLQFDDHTDGVFGFEIFFPYTPIISIDKLVLGSAADCGTELVFNKDFYFDQNRIYLLRSSTMFIQNMNIPHDGAGVLSAARGHGGWCLNRPTRILFCWGKSGNPQAKLYQMTATGDAAAQTDAWQISDFVAPSTLYWTMKKTGTTEVTITVTADAFGAQVVAKGKGTAGTPQVVKLWTVDGSGIAGQVSINYTADTAAANTLALTPDTAATLDTSSIPQGIVPKVTLATRLVAAAFSGHNRKEEVGLDGQTAEISDRTIPKTVFQMLGRQNPILV